MIRYEGNSRQLHSIIYVVDCADLSGNGAHKQVGMDRVTTSGRLGDVMVCTFGTGCAGRIGRALVSHKGDCGFRTEVESSQ